MCKLANTWECFYPLTPGYFSQSRLRVPQLLLVWLLHMAGQAKAEQGRAGQGIVVASDNNLQISLKGTLKISQFPEQLEPSNFTNQKLFWIHSSPVRLPVLCPFHYAIPLSLHFSPSLSLSFSFPYLHLETHISLSAHVSHFSSHHFLFCFARIYLTFILAFCFL